MILFKKHKIKALFLAVNLLFTAISYSQNIDFNPVLKEFKTNNFKQIKKELFKIDTLKINDYDKATWFYYYADYQFRIDKHHVAYSTIIKSEKLFKSLNKFSDVIDCYILLLEILSHQNDLKVNTDDILNKMEKYAINQKDKKILEDVYYRIALKYFNLRDANKSIIYFNKMIPLCLLNDDSLTIAHVYVNIGTVHSSIIKNPDSALYYYKKAAPILKTYKDVQNLSYNYNNQGNNYKFKKNYLKAITYFKKALETPLKKNIQKSKVLYYENIADAYYKNKDYKNAAFYLNKKINLQDSINDTKQNIAIAGIKEKYDNEKLRADKLTIEAEKTKTKNILKITLIILFFSVLIGFLIYKNIKRKQKITQDEKLIEQQKVSNLLKEQELIAIDAMIEGQEKERQLIASDLHDDLGALMATLQFNFENLYKHKNSNDADNLFKKTKLLIKEAYHKIRSIAQIKNSGVIAKQGLLKAIINNANKISTFHNINIEVREHGLDNRLENSLELTIFRIVQELLTNIVKHAKATNVIIHFTNHNDSLNIMVEDNGIGFNVKNISKNEGMGIQSIEKRVEVLEGTVIIESIKSKGTTIIIDLPI